MDKVWSTRMDESVANRVHLLSKQLKKTKKEVVEQAILALYQQTDLSKDKEVFSQTFGAWERKESVEKSISRARRAFRRALSRHSR